MPPGWPPSGLRSWRRSPWRTRPVCRPDRHDSRASSPWRGGPPPPGSARSTGVRFRYRSALSPLRFRVRHRREGAESLGWIDNVDWVVTPRRGRAESRPGLRIRPESCAVTGPQGPPRNRPRELSQTARHRRGRGRLRRRRSLMFRSGADSPRIKHPELYSPRSLRLRRGTRDKLTVSFFAVGSEATGARPGSEVSSATGFAVSVGSSARSSHASSTCRAGRRRRSREGDSRSSPQPLPASPPARRVEGTIVPGFPRRGPRRGPIRSRARRRDPPMTGHGPRPRPSRRRGRVLPEVFKGIDVEPVPPGGELGVRMLRRGEVQEVEVSHDRTGDGGCWLRVARDENSADRRGRGQGQGQDHAGERSRRGAGA